MKAYVARPLVLLGILSALSLAARVAFLGEPCRSPCRSATDRVLVFDEDYYVNAARVIAGLRPPRGAPYADAPTGDDPNAEHPQLAKLVIAGSIELLGDGPLAWRLGSLVFGSLAILGLFVLVRAAGGGQWLALGACSLMVLDNLVLVHGRIATLDIYALAAMIWGVALYLRGRPLAAGAVIGLGACFKLVAPYALLVLAVFEAFRWRAARADRRQLASLGVCALSAAAVFVALLAVLDQVAPPYDATTGKLVGGGPFGHIGHMLSYAARQTSPHGPRGIASYPWQWLVDYKPITYLRINPARPSAGLQHIHPAVHFIGIISPSILVLALPALAVASLGVARQTPRSSSEAAMLGLAWFLGTFAPFVLLSVVWNRTSYLYYMVIVMPGIYMTVACLVSRIRTRRKLTGAWMLAVIVAAIVTYPFTPLP